MNTYTKKLEFSFLPDGRLNVPYLGATAKKMLEQGSAEEALVLFRTISYDDQRGYLGHYGMGLCYVKTGETQMALSSFEAAFTLNPKPYIAVAILETLTQVRELQRAKMNANRFKFLAKDSPILDKRISQVIELAETDEKISPNTIDLK